MSHLVIATLPLNVLPLSLVGVRTIRLEIWFKPCRYIQRTQELIQLLISSSWNQKLPVPCQLVYRLFAKSKLANWKSKLSLTMSLTNLFWLMAGKDVIREGTLVPLLPVHQGYVTILLGLSMAAIPVSD